MNPSKTRKIRKLLAALSPKDEAKLLAANLADDLKEIEKKISEIPKQKDYAQSIQELRNELIGRILELPSTDELNYLRAEFESKLASLETENIEPIQEQMQDIVSNEITTDENLRDDLENRIKRLRLEFLNRLNNLGGGSQNQRIQVNGTVMSTKYADFNLIGSGITVADNNTTKQVDITIPDSAASIGGTITGGTEGSVLFIDSAGDLAQDNANFFWDDTNNWLGIGMTPATILDILGSGNTGYLNVYNNNGNTSGVFRAGSTTGYNIVSLRNNVGSVSRSLDLYYSGATYASALLTNGPTGESGALTTTGAYPLALGTNGTAAITILNGGNVGIGTISPGALLTVEKDAIGVTSTDGLLLQNLTAAAVGAQQWSPRLHLIGQAWGTAAGTSQTNDWIMEVRSVQNTTGLSNLVVSYQKAGAGYVKTFGVDNSNGSFTFYGTTNVFKTSGLTTGIGYGTISNTGGRLDIGVDSSAGGVLSTGTLAYAAVINSSGAANALQFGTNDSVKMTILSGGNVGIGTTGPTRILSLKAGASTTLLAQVGGCVFDHFVDAGNVGTGEDDLYTDTLAASTLATNGDKIVATYAGIFVGAALSTQELRVYFGGTKIYDSGALAIGAATDNWTVNVVCIRVSSSVVRCTVYVSTDFATLFPYSVYTEVTGLTLTATQVLKITGEAAGAGTVDNQIVAKLGYGEWKSAA